jgi:hypothetical protein
VSIITSFPEVVGRLMTVYQRLQEHIGNRSTSSVYLNDSVDFLSQLKVQGELAPQRSSVQQISNFFDFFLI